MRQPDQIESGQNDVVNDEKKIVLADASTDDISSTIGQMEAILPLFKGLALYFNFLLCIVYVGQRLRAL